MRRNPVLIIACLLIIFCISTQANAQSYFKKSYSDSVHGHWDEGFIETADSGYVVFSNETGIFNTNGGMLFKISSTGQFLWRKTYHYHPNQYPVFKGICLIDSGIVVTTILDSSNAYGFLKLDNAGNLLSVVKLDKLKAPQHPYAHNPVLKNGAGIVFFGNDSSGNFPVVAKTDLNGNMLWSKKLTVGLVCSENIVNMDVDSLGNIYVSCDDWGNTCGTDSITKLIKIDSSGNVIWAKEYTFGFQTRDVSCVNNNKIIIAGKIPTIDPPAFAIEVDSSGNIIYSKLYFWNVGIQDIQMKFDASSNRNLFVIDVYSQLAFYKQYIMLTDENGVALSLKSNDDSVSNSFSNAVANTIDNGWALIGSDIIKYDSSFNSLCTITTEQVVDSSFSPVVTQLNVIADTVDIQSSILTYVVNINTASMTEDVECLPLTMDDLIVSTFSIYPNPSTDKILIQFEPRSVEFHFEIYDVSGKLLMNDSKAHPGEEINISELKQGLYFLRINVDGYAFSEKFTKN